MVHGGCSRIPITKALWEIIRRPQLFLSYDRPVSLSLSAASGASRGRLRNVLIKEAELSPRYRGAPASSQTRSVWSITSRF
jgi:hypothetical protein